MSEPRKFEQDIKALIDAIRIERREVIQRFVSGQTKLDETLSQLVVLQHGYEAVRHAQGDEANIVFHAQRMVA
jgi:hypothetical protein